MKVNKLFLIVLLVATYVFGISQSGYTREIGPSTIVKITHSHSHDHSHDHHHNEELEHAGTTADNSSPSRDQNSHSHELMICGSSCVAVPGQSFSMIHLSEISIALKAMEPVLPQDAGLASIFRPPIA